MEIQQQSETGRATGTTGKVEKQYSNTATGKVEKQYSKWFYRSQYCFR